MREFAQLKADARLKGIDVVHDPYKGQRRPLNYTVTMPDGSRLRVRGRAKLEELIDNADGKAWRIIFPYRQQERE